MSIVWGCDNMHHIKFYRKLLDSNDASGRDVLNVALRPRTLWQMSLLPSIHAYEVKPVLLGICHQNQIG
jgi:hypothetical protein